MEQVTHNVFEILKEYSKVGTKKESIYKPAILQGTEKQRKAIRRKIRNSRDNIIDAFNNAPTKEEKQKISKAWIKFAKEVYQDIDIIFEANTTDDKAATLAKFVADVKALNK